MLIRLAVRVKHGRVLDSSFQHHESTTPHSRLVSNQSGGNDSINGAFGTKWRTVSLVARNNGTKLIWHSRFQQLGHAFAFKKLKHYQGIATFLNIYNSKECFQKPKSADFFGHLGAAETTFEQNIIMSSPFNGDLLCFVFSPSFSVLYMFLCI